MVNATISKGADRIGEEKTINGVSVCSRLSWLRPKKLEKVYALYDCNYVNSTIPVETSLLLFLLSQLP